jgi:hypothetical protein
VYARARGSPIEAPAVGFRDTGESMEEDDMVMRVGNSLSTERERDEPMRREGLQARGLIRRC